MNIKEKGNLSFNFFLECLFFRTIYFTMFHFPNKNRFTKALFFVFASFLFCSHDLYLKLDSYFLSPNTPGTLNLYNGTFERSENLIDRDRMLDASMVAHGERKSIPLEQWEDKDSTITQLTFNSGKEGTYLVGVSTKAKNIELSAKKFNDYLKHDGVLDMLDYRTKNNLLHKNAVESYQKHVKAIYQVGKERTQDWSTVLGYPIEFVPLENPYEKHTGDSLQVKLLLDGKPLANQLVYANFLASEHGHSHETEHSHGTAQNTSKGDSTHTHSDIEHSHTSGETIRTNQEGISSIHLPEDGIYYLRTIHMINVADGSDLTHSSKWATLTFEVTHEHGSHTHTHGSDEIPTWIFVVVSLVLLGALFFYFQKK